MPLLLTDAQRADLEAAARAEKGVRRWRRYQAVLLLAEGQPVAAVAQTLRCSGPASTPGRRAGARTAWPDCAKAITAAARSSWMRPARRG